MEQSYRTILEYAQAEFIERKSRFIGSIQPCHTEEEALAFLEQKRKQYWDATHNVYAYVLRESGIKRCSDDGEPQGTAGRPVLDVLEKEGLVDVCVVATRYFGGIMLGAGGLVRAYSHTSKIAVDAAQIMNMCVCSHFHLVFDYSLYGKLSYLFPNYPMRILSSDFGEQVSIDLVIRSDAESEFLKAITELTNGQLHPVKTGESFEDIS